jgi:FkbH-like protein
MGEAYLALQRYALRLKERGVILAICSKNESAVAENAIQNHPEMLLKRSDFAAFAVNWEDKATNIIKIASELNIGLNSLVFADDNPIERARVREALPMVAVPEMPEDAANYARTIALGGYFESVSFTAEDRYRAESYATDAKRNALMNVSTSLGEFLAGLEMSVIYGPFAQGDLGRVTQLINKTNQFNTTTYRYAPNEVASKAAAPGYITLQFRLVDRYGDNGIVSTMIIRRDDDEPTTARLESWVMSCRVFGRELEFEAMNIAVEAAQQSNVRIILAEYIPTPKNAIIKDLYPNLGFAPLGISSSAGVTRWRLDISNYRSRETHISRQRLCVRNNQMKDNSDARRVGLV